MIVLTTVEQAGEVQPDHRRLRARVEAEAYVASVCFKHGPPRLVGVELEWTAHHRDDPARRLEPAHLAAALGPHAPATVRAGSPHDALPAGSLLTVEPGGQVEISSLPATSLGTVIDAVAADTAYLTGRLDEAGLVLGTRGLDPHRGPRRVLDTPRYAAMEHAFTPLGPEGLTMMCATAGLQVCLDAGEADQVATRFAAITSLGPVCTALFANSPADGWASARARAVLGIQPGRSSPVPATDDPAAAWARQVVDTPLLFARRPGADWTVPHGVTFADWIDGALPRPPTVDDLDYHLTSMFTPVRPHGYVEVRYLDAQPGPEWVVPVALLTALMADPRTVDAVVDACAPVADRWLEAARLGLADPPTAAAARRVLDLGIPAVDRLDLPAATRAHVLQRCTALVDRTHTAGRTP
ncbi:glutamate-cysteine ligase family protein [Actinokineospora bangkokensis]|uniref:Glutamate--cysteine ligase EgtA n=1 Tax=Actinokineospora bangkokensis TaxID=1193682 RepID=A0A1Q9LR92_9PSEU|nr:glutamate-cysteine ligase family protein [Actinokineospora bangkokensis]OLR94545.1 ergothioneine biosynthesis glutamate--cysteine ligase EgtA [Actinokineospora bangkokensis]